VRSLTLPRSGRGFGPGGNDADVAPEDLYFRDQTKRATRRPAKPAAVDTDMGEEEADISSRTERILCYRSDSGEGGVRGVGKGGRGNEKQAGEPNIF
jgi:hypothetical protein